MYRLEKIPGFKIYYRKKIVKFIIISALEIFPKSLEMMSSLCSDPRNVSCLRAFIRIFCFKFYRISFT